MSNTSEAWNNLQFHDITSAPFLPSGQAWRKITYKECTYFISDHGECYSMPKGRVIVCNWRKVFTRVYGQYSLMGQWFSAHRLVLLAFGAPQPTLAHEVNHKDGNGMHNHIDNLEWATKSENQLHAYKNGRRVVRGAEHWRHGQKASEAVKAAIRERQQGETHSRFKGYWVIGDNAYTSLSKAAQATGLNARTIQRACKSGKAGYEFRPKQ